jgi:RNA polymerase sigma-70 factor (ECF subfamily)
MSSVPHPALVASSPDGAALDRPALERLYVKLEKPMFNVVYRWVWNASDAQEIVQDAFLKVWKARAAVEMATVEPLLYRTALNLASNKRRSSRLWRFIGMDDAGDPPSREKVPDAALAQEQTRARVKKAIEALPDHLREVVLLSEYSELTHPQIGEMLGIPAGTVASRRHTALEKLAAELGDLEEATK